MATNTKFKIDLDTGNFIVNSNENIYDYDIPIMKVIESYYFESEWDFENNLIRFEMDNEDVLEHLKNKNSNFRKIAKTAVEHHFSVMRYERI